MATNMVNPQEHKFVVVLDGNAFGFTTTAAAVSFIEEISAGRDASKLLIAIATAMGDGKGEDFGIYDIESYVDLFMDDEDDELDD